MRHIKYTYYAACLLFFGFLFDVYLNFSDDWESCQSLLSKSLYYQHKMESITFDRSTV